MSERFTVEKLDLVSDHLSTRFFIVDNENMKDYDVQHIVSEGFEVQFDSWAEKIADKLNELSEENEEYKLELERKNIIIKRLEKQIDARVNIFNDFIKRVDDEELKKELLELRYSI